MTQPGVWRGYATFAPKGDGDWLVNLWPSKPDLPDCYMITIEIPEELWSAPEIERPVVSTVAE